MSETLGHSRWRSRSPKRSTATTSMPFPRRELGQHARADRDEQDHRSPSSSATNRTAVTTSAVVPGLSALPSRRSDASNACRAACPASPRTPPAARTRSAPADTLLGGGTTALARDEGVRDRREQAQEQLDRRGARPQPVVERARQRREPELEGHGVAGRVLGGDRVAVGGRRHRVAQGEGGRGAHVVLDGLVETARPGDADGLIGGARIVQREGAQHLLRAGTQRSSAEQRRPRERRQEQRDAEIRVGAGDAARRAHRGEDGVADAPVRRPSELRSQRDRAAQHVLVGGVREVVPGRDVARLLGARLEHAGQLRGAGDRVWAPARSRRGVRTATRRLLDLHSRDRIACRAARDRHSDAVSCRGGVSTTWEERRAWRVPL